MSKRRCVICGGKPPEKDAEGNEAYAYPKTEEEARIWQISMQAKGCCVESIQQECCVCVEHIPDFVRRAKMIGSRLSAQERKKALRKVASVSDACKCPDDGPPGKERPSVGVLLLNGASLPTYCATGQSCVNMRQLPAEEGDGEAKVTKRINTTDSNTEIFVLESGFQDNGGKFPDIDGTEVTLLRTPMQEEEELQRLRQELQQQEEEAEEEEDPSVRRPRNSCLPGCTDVLLLGRGHHPTDECPCHCEQCSKPSGVPDPKDPCCRPECCPESQALQFTQPPCGCECELQARRELGRVIRTQNDRIRELEALLCRQNNMRTCLQRKLDELYCEFGRLDEAEADANRSRLTCPGSDRGGPDCASVREPPPPRYDEPRVSRSRSHSSRKSVVLEPTPRPLPPKKPPKEPKEEELLPPPGERVHWLSQQSPETAKCTQRPHWVNEAEDDADTMSTLRSKISFKFAEMSRMGPPSMPRSNDSNPSYTPSYTSASYSNTNSSYSNINRSKSNDSRSNGSRA